MKRNICKRITGLLLALVMATSLLPAASAAGSDLDGHWAQEAMQSFADAGYLYGDGNGHYSPNGSMTRAQFAAIMNRVTGLTTESAGIANYTDLSTSDWYYSDLAKALAAGYMTGTSTTTMSPNATITRQQAFTMLARYLGLDRTDTSSLDAFTDANKIAEYARGGVAAMVNAGYVQGNNQKIQPEKTLTRAEGVTVLSRALAALQAVVPTVTATYKDGVYTGTGAGYGGTMKIQVTISGGKMTSIEILSNSETSSYLTRAKKLIDTLLEKQTTDNINAISGATKSSNAILTAVGACLSQASGGADTSKTGSTGSGGGGTGNSTKPTDQEFDRLTDGTYEGSAAGYSGTTRVKVTVSDGKITAIEVLSHGDTSSYFNRASAVIDKVIASQSTSVDAISGATYSSYGIVNAVANALKDATTTGAVTHKVSTWKELTAALAKAQDGDTVQLTADITDGGNVDGVSSATATINKAITLDGNGKTMSAYKGKVTATTTSKETGESSSQPVDATFCFGVTTATGIQIQNLTIDGASFSSKLGGAMYVKTGVEVTLSNVTFRNCKAGKGGAGNGGAAIYAESHSGTSPTVTASNCTFENNAVTDGTTGRGGAVAGYNANLVLQNCTFSGNKAAYGGAVAAAGSSQLTVTGCTFESSNNAVYGGDDIYIFDGYTFYKKDKTTDSAVQYVLSGNTHKQKDGADFTGYRVVLGRVLGTVSDTTNSTKEGTLTRKDCAGSGAIAVSPVRDLTFTVTDYDRKGTPTENTSKYQFVLMNIPYAKFYAADVNNPVAVDAFTSATKDKTRTASLAGGSYHVKADGTDITGVTFPVAVPAGFALNDYTKVTDETQVTIEVTNRGKTTRTVYTGKNALFEQDSYAYYVLPETEIPTYYKVLSDGKGGLEFSRTHGISQTLSGVTASFTTETTYGDYQLNLMGIKAFDRAGDDIYGVVLHTEKGRDYGLRHLENIWLGTQLAWCTGFTSAVHNCPTRSAHYEAMMGQTLTGVTYYTSKGIFEIALDNIYVPVKFEKNLSVESADASKKTTALTATGFPEDYSATYAVSNAAGTDVTKTYGFAVVGSNLTWSTVPPVGQYTLTVSDSSGVYATYPASFELQTSVLPAQASADSLSIVKTETATDKEFASYLSAITSVKVGDKSYSVSGRGAVTIVNENGFVDLTAAPFTSMTADSTYVIEITATGYSVPLTFTLKVPGTITNDTADDNTVSGDTTKTEEESITTEGVSA